MSTHTATIRWERTTPGFGYTEYSRRHSWSFDGGISVPAASAPGFRGDPSCVDPEEAYVAALSSCHMLWFLHLASDAGFMVSRYVDTAEGTMEKAADGKMWVSRVVLCPDVTFDEGHPAPGAETLNQLHEEAHENCFLARSVKSEVIVKTKRAVETERT